MKPAWQKAQAIHAIDVVIIGYWPSIDGALKKG